MDAGLKPRGPGIADVWVDMELRIGREESNRSKARVKTTRSVVISMRLPTEIGNRLKRLFRQREVQDISLQTSQSIRLEPNPRAFSEQPHV
jgi:hypothetical protein